MRLSDAEREEAMEVLSEHVRTGRLNLTEFTDRSERVTAAKTRRDLQPVFDDLPAPYPSALATAGATAATGATAPTRRFVPGIIPIALVAAAALIFITRNPFLAGVVALGLVAYLSTRARR
ncbi:DUF1707 domain-containing protein [Amycolatopsis minnesotensis]